MEELDDNIARADCVIKKQVDGHPKEDRFLFIGVLKRITNRRFLWMGPTWKKEQWDIGLYETSV